MYALTVQKLMVEHCQLLISANAREVEVLAMKLRNTVFGELDSRCISLFNFMIVM